MFITFFLIFIALSWSDLNQLNYRRFSEVYWEYLYVYSVINNPLFTTYSISFVIFFLWIWTRKILIYFFINSKRSMFNLYPNSNRTFSVCIYTKLAQKIYTGDYQFSFCGHLKFSQQTFAKIFPLFFIAPDYQLFQRININKNIFHIFI